MDLIEANYISISSLGKKYGLTNDRVYALLAAKGVEPKVIVPFSRGFMRQYAREDLPDLSGDVEKAKAETRAQRQEHLRKQQRKANTPSARAKATANRLATLQAKKDKELKQLRKLRDLLARTIAA